MISRRKLMKGLKEKAEWKDFSKTPSLKKVLKEHKEAWDTVTEDNFQALSDSIDNKPSQYKHFMPDKKKLSDKVKFNYKRMIDITDNVMEVREEPVISNNANIVNTLNTIELDRFKRLYFIKNMKKKIIEKEKLNAFNYVNERKPYVDQALKGLLDNVNNVSYENKEFNLYERNMRELKNSKIHDMLYLIDDIPGENSQNNAEEVYLLPERSDEKKAAEDRDDTEGVKLDQFIRSDPQHLIHVEGSEEGLTEKQKNLIQLSKEDYRRCQEIVEYENNAFELNRDLFAPKNRLSNLTPEARSYYLKQHVHSTEDILSLSQYYIENNVCEEMFPLFYNRIGELITHSSYFYENDQFVDLHTISNKMYKSLLKRNVKAVKNMDLSSFVHFTQSFLALHRREKGRLIGKLYDRTKDIVIRGTYFWTVKNREAVVSDPFHFGLLLESVLKLNQVPYLVNKNLPLLEYIIDVIKEIRENDAVRDFQTQTRLHTFLSSIYLLKNDVTGLEAMIADQHDHFLDNLPVLLNPGNFNDFFDSLCKIHPLITKEQSLTLMIKLKQDVLPNIAPFLSLSNLENLSSYMVLTGSSDFSVYHTIRKHSLKLFDDPIPLKAEAALQILNNCAYMEMLNVHNTLFRKDSQNDFIHVLYLKNIFNL